MTPDAIKSLAEIRARLASDAAKAHDWLKTPLAAFDGRTALELIERGESELLLPIAAVVSGAAEG